MDLTAPPKTTDTDVDPHDNWVRGGGMLYHGNAPHPSPGTPTLSLTLTRIVTVKGSPVVKQAVEVTATNTGKALISVPVGTDPVPLLKRTQEDRRSFFFTVVLGKSKRVGFAESASNKAHASTRVLLQPGDEVTFLLPVIVAGSHGPEEEIGVSIQLFRRVLEGDRDWTEGVGEAIRSENTLPLP